MNIHEEIVSNIRVLSKIFYSPPNKIFLDELENEVLDKWPDYVDPCNIISQAMKKSIQTEGDEKVLLDFTSLFIGSRHIGSWRSAYTDKNKLLVGQNAHQFKAYCIKNDIHIDLTINEPNEYIGVFLYVLSEILDKARQNISLQQLTILLEQHMNPWLKLFITQIEDNANTEYFLGAATLLENLIDYLENKISNTKLLN